MGHRSVPELRRPSGGATTIAWLVLGFGLAGFAAAQSSTPGKSAATRATSDPVVARVQDSSIRLSEIESNRARNEERYRTETGRPIPPGYESFFLRAGLEEAVRSRLLLLDAKARGGSVSDARAESLMKLDPFFQVNGTFDGARFTSYRATNPQSFAAAREQAKDLLLYEQRLRELEGQFAPDARMLDAITAQKDMKAKMEYLVISEQHYDAKYDPTDAQLRAFYETEKSGFARPAEIGYTALSVPFDPSQAGAADAARARANELLARIRSGTPFDSLVLAPGVTPSSDVFRPADPKGALARSRAMADTALASAPGRVLPSVIPGTREVSVVRVDRVQTSRVPPLSEIATDLRARYRARRIEEEDRALARAYYDAHPDSFATPAWSARWAIVDSTLVPVPAPKEDVLRAWFDEHRSEFARLDPNGGGIVMRSFEEARPAAEARWREIERARRTRELADNLAIAWAKGKDGEKSAAIRAAGPAWLVRGGAEPPGMPRALADSARARTIAPSAMVTSDPVGYAVLGVVRYENRYRTSFETVEPRAKELAMAEKAVADRKSNRAWFDGHRDRFVTGPGAAFTYVLSAPPPTTQIDVTSAEIERYYREHATEFMSPIEARVRHILIMRQGRGDAAARQLAQQLLARIRRGEDFRTLARDFSEDPGSKADGGDLGFIRAGATVPEFERAAFALTPAHPLSDLVSSEFGYHIIQLVERRGGVVTPLADVRAEIGRQVATANADSIARRNAESLRSQVRTRQELLDVADQRHMASGLSDWREGLPLSGPSIIDELRADALRTGKDRVLPRVYTYLKQGYAVVWVDSMLAPRPIEYEEVESRIADERVRFDSRGAAKARADRLAADLAAGKSWAEATETIGGVTTTRDLALGEPLPTTGPLPQLDSLVYGPGPDTLAAGSWARMTTPQGELFVRLVSRTRPDAKTLAAARERTRALVINRRVYDYIETLRVKYPVEVLRADLAERLPPPPAM